jgi:hypothetical protein
MKQTASTSPLEPFNQSFKPRRRKVWNLLPTLPKSKCHDTAMDASRHKSNVVHTASWSRASWGQWPCVGDEGARDIGVEVDDVDDIGVKLSDECHIVCQPIRATALLVLADLPDQHVVVLEDLLHLIEALL